VDQESVEVWLPFGTGHRQQKAIRIHRLGHIGDLQNVLYQITIKRKLRKSQKLQRRKSLFKMDLANPQIKGKFNRKINSHCFFWPNPVNPASWPNPQS
jgi:hypothetical protein